MRLRELIGWAIVGIAGVVVLSLLIYLSGLMTILWA